MKKIILILLLVAVTVSTMAYKGEVVGAPIIELGMIRQLELNNGDIPTLINLISKEYGIDETTLINMLKCESGLRQYDKNGDVLLSTTGDSGVGQINLRTWSSKAKKLGYDLDNPVDNLLMVAWIIQNDSNGLDSWVCYKKIK